MGSCSDTGTDTGTATGTATDTSTGTGTDTGTDTGIDTGTGTDTGKETDADAGADAGTDTDTDTCTGTGTDTDTNGHKHKGRHRNGKARCSETLYKLEHNTNATHCKRCNTPQTQCNTLAYTINRNGKLLKSANVITIRKYRPAILMSRYVDKHVDK